MADYYTYIAGSGDWWTKTPPARNLHFERELELLGGKNTFDMPILRVSWGGSLLSDVAFKPTKKYKKLWYGLTHFTYRDDEGRMRKILREDEAPEGKLVLPVYQTLELGRLRWVLEKWQSIEDAVAGGRFNDSKDADGNRLFREPPAKGVYNAWFWVETADGGFRDLDNEVLEVIKQMWRYNETTSIDQKVADMIEDERKERREAAAEAQAAWTN